MRYKGSINLLALKGAQVLNVTMPDQTVKACIVIPAAYNDMQAEDGSVNPYVNFVAWEASQKFVDACKQRHAGQEGYVAPCHTIDQSYSQGFREKAEAAAKARIQREKPGLSEDELKREVSIATRISLGTLAEMPMQLGYKPTQGAVAVAQEALPPANEDLPF